MNNRNNKKIESALYLVDEIQCELVRIETRAGHSAEMALVRRAMLRVKQLRRKLRSAESQRSEWKLDWKISIPFLMEVAEYLIKRK
jgi:hypothetical protein